MTNANDLRAREKKLIERMDSLGLVMEVNHEIYDRPKTLGTNVCPKDGCIEGYFHEYGDDDKLKNRTKCPKCKGTGKRFSRPRYYRGSTWVWLFKKDEWDSRRAKKDFSLGYFVAEGRTRCSVLEQGYNKRQGRTLALARALKSYDKTLVEMNDS